MKPGETSTERKAVYFTVYDDGGLLASGNAGEGVVCSPAAAELQWKRATGTAYANSTGTFAHVGDGLYRYIPADAEVQASDGEAVAVIKLKKSGFSTQFVPVPIIYNSPDTIQTAATTAIAAAVMAYAHESGRTILGVMRRLDAMLTGKATGLVGTLATFYRADGTTKAIEATQDTTLGTRVAASTVGGD
jgi:hypothetical protein